MCDKSITGHQVTHTSAPFTPGRTGAALGAGQPTKLRSWGLRLGCFGGLAERGHSISGAGCRLENIQRKSAPLPAEMFGRLWQPTQANLDSALHPIPTFPSTFPAYDSGRDSAVYTIRSQPLRLKYLATAIDRSLTDSLRFPTPAIRRRRHHNIPSPLSLQLPILALSP